MPLAEAQSMPLTALLPILNIVQPPTDNLPAIRRWLDEKGRMHRDYDLPAAITSSGTMVWAQHGQNHRGQDKPAIIHGLGAMEWWVNDQRHRDGGKPAIVKATGWGEWWEHGRYIRKAPWTQRPSR